MGGVDVLYSYHAVFTVQHMHFVLQCIPQYRGMLLLWSHHLLLVALVSYRWHSFRGQSSFYHLHGLYVMPET